jgi:3-oxoacyl-[acyl-carrier protein] reductase
MYLSTIDADLGSTAPHPELAGARVLLTGVCERAGLDVARAFADHGCRMVVQCDEASPETDAIAEVVARSLAEMRLYTGRFGVAEEPVPFAQKAAQAYGGLDVVVNFITLEPADLADCVTVAEIEDRVSAKLLAPTLITRVAANRMRLTLAEGLVVNVVLLPAPRNAGEEAFAGLMRAAVAALTRGEAREWAGQAIRINAIAPRSDVEPASGACLDNEPDVAALILHLAGKRGRTLSGLVFDARC